MEDPYHTMRYQLETLHNGVEVPQCEGTKAVERAIIRYRKVRTVAHRGRPDGSTTEEGGQQTKGEEQGGENVVTGQHKRRRNAPGGEEG